MVLWSWYNFLSSRAAMCGLRLNSSWPITITAAERTRIKTSTRTQTKAALAHFLYAVLSIIQLGKDEWLFRIRSTSCNNSIKNDERFSVRTTLLSTETESQNMEINRTKSVRVEIRSKISCILYNRQFWKETFYFR